ncbi:MAG: RNA polymerase sigma factor [Methylococcales bacterium]
MELQSYLLQNKNKRTMPSATDSELVARVRCGEMQAFEVIMRRHNQRLYRLARSILRDEHESMDVVQEAYVKAYYNIHQFKGPNSFVSWLSRITCNEALMRVRKRKRIQYTLDDPNNTNQDVKSTDPEPMDEIAAQQLRKLLEEAIDTLPIDYRCVYVMRAIQHLSTIETANSLGVSEQVVKTRYLRAKRALRKVIEKHMEQAGLKVFEFAGQRCDLIVQEVMEKLQNN